MSQPVAGEVVVVGSFIQDLIFEVDTLPGPGETRVARLALAPGGKGSNQAIACRRQGARTLFVCAVGADAFGKAQAALAATEGLACATEVLDGAPTGAAGIFIDARARNVIAVALGAAGELGTAHVERQAPAIKVCRVLLAQLESGLPATHRALELAREGGALTILNPAPIRPDAGREIFALADILTPNETELSFLLRNLHGVNVTPEEIELLPPSRIAGLCSRLGSPCVIATLGARGAIVHRSPSLARAPRLPPDRQLTYHVAPSRVSPVDSTGAGDAFNGALAAEIARGAVATLAEAAQRATVAAGLSTQARGAAPSMPLREQVEVYLAEHGLPEVSPVDPG